MVNHSRRFRVIKLKDHSRNKKVSITALIALVISIGSFALSLFQYYKNNAEIVYASQMRRYTNNLTMLKKMEIGDFIGTFNTEFEVLIANRSNNPVSIVSHAITNKIDENELNYSNIIQGFFDEDGTPLKYINIDSYSSKVIIIKTAYLLKKSIYEKIKEKYAFETKYSFVEFRDDIYKNGTDLFGNKIVYQNYNDNYLFTRKESSLDQDICITFLTLNKNKIVIDLYLYSR